MKFEKNHLPIELEQELLTYIDFGDDASNLLETYLQSYEKEMKNKQIPPYIWITMNYTSVEPWEPGFAIIVKDLIEKKEFGMLACITLSVKIIKGQ